MSRHPGDLRLSRPTPEARPAQTRPGFVVRVLGPVAVMAGGRPVAVRGQQGLVLSLLAEAHPHQVEAEVLADTLWGEAQPPTGRVGLRVVMNRLRARLGQAHPTADGPIVHEGTAYRLTLPGRALDSRVFEDAVVEARQITDPGRATVLSIHALQLWQGRPYQPFSDTDRLAGTAARLTGLRREAEERLVDALLADARPEVAATWAAGFVVTEPYREQRWEQLMLALYRAGRQTEALQAARRVTSLLLEELGVEPGPGIRRLQADILRHAPELAGPPTPSRSRARAEKPFGVADLRAALCSEGSQIPRPQTTFVGRETELSRLTVLLDGHRLVSLLGPPGVGKTRLATEYAVGTTDRRVVWVDLVPVGGDDVVGALAERIDTRSDGGSDLATVVSELRRQPTLVVFDNAEHLTGPVARTVSVLLDGCQDVRILVTSRSGIGLACDQRLLLGPLPGPDALALLIERSGRHPADAREQASMARLAADFDGLPLPIELIASALAVTAPEELVDPVTEVLGPGPGAEPAHPGPARRQGLTGAIDWSLSLLDGPDRMLFARLGVLRGSYDTQDVADLWRLPVEECRAGLRRLAEAGLISAERDPDGRPRWRQLNVIAAAARTTLARTGCLRSAERRHVVHHLSLVRRAAGELTGPEETRAVLLLDRVRDQLPVVHEHLLADGDPRASAAFTLGLWEYTFFRQHFHHFGWLEDTLAMPGVEEIGDYEELLAQSALAAWARDRPVQALDLAVRAQQVAQERDRPVPLAALKTRFNLAYHEQDLLRAGRLLVRLSAESSARDDQRHRCDNLVVATFGWNWLGMPGQAKRTARHALALAEVTGNPTSVAWARVALASTQALRDPEEAARSSLAAARLAASVHNRFVQEKALSQLVRAMRRQGRLETARSLLLEVAGRWGQARAVAQLWWCCQEAALILGALGRLRDAAIMTEELAMLDRHYPLPVDDKRRLAQITAEAGALHDGPPPALPSPDPAVLAAHLTSRLLAALAEHS